MMEPKSCYNCKHRNICYLRWIIEDKLFSFPGRGFIDLRDINYEKNYVRFYEVLADICKEYEFKEEK